MQDATLFSLIKDFREDYQVPSYKSDDSIKRLILAADSWMNNSVRQNCNYQNDYSAKKLLFERAFCDYQHRLDEFMDCYRSEIITFQMADFDSTLEAEGYDEE